MTNTSDPDASGLLANTILATTTASLSLFGTLFIIISYFAWTDIRTTSRRILCYISIADFFTAIGTIMGHWSGNKTVCLVQSIIGTCSVLSSFFWTIFMALYLYVGITRRLPVLAERLMCLFHVFGWGVPVVITSIAASTDKLGNNANLVSAGWCWVNVDMSWGEQIKWMLIAGKFWEITASVIITILYVLVKRSMKQERKFKNDKHLCQRSAMAAQKAEKKLILIPLAFILLHIWGTIRFFTMINGGPHQRPNEHIWLLILQGIGDSAQGFANFCIFCFFTDKVLSQVKSYCRSCCARWCHAFCHATNFKRKQRPPHTTPVEGCVTDPSMAEPNGGIDNPVVASEDCVTVNVSCNVRDSINVG